MSTIPWIRCDHCLSRLPEAEGRSVGGDTVCEKCARLAGAPAAPPPPTEPAVEASVGSAGASNPHPLPPDSGEAGAAAIDGQIRRHAGRPPGTREDPRGDRQVFLGPDDPEAELRRDPRISFEPRDDRSMARRALDDIDAWCAGKWWFVRAPLLVYFAIAWVRHASDPMYQSLFKGFNLGVHELGHYVFGPFGDVTAAWGGSLLQLLVPLLAVPMFVRQRDYFAVAVALGWLGTNFFEVATYAADAVAMSLPLVTPGGGHPIHDWNFVLGAKGWLRHTATIAALHRAAGHGAMLACLAGGGWICWKMIRTKPAPAEPAGS